MRPHVPTLMALTVATLAAWIVKDALPTIEGVPLPLAIALVVWSVVFPIAKRFFADIRPGE